MNWKKELRELSRVEELGQPYSMIVFTTIFGTVDIEFYGKLSFSTPFGVICFGEDVKPFVKKLNKNKVSFKEFKEEYLKYYNELVSGGYGEIHQKELL